MIAKLFTTPDGKNRFFTFALVTSLFLLWGFCNGMIDVMDKHFQEELKLSLAQSAWVQFAHYLGYFLMALPAGWLASKLGYKSGIVAGLLLVAVGGFWFLPATHIASFWAFLLGVCLIASGLTFLETVANPYTTVLGPREFAATRINLAQSCNGIGWIFGPIAGAKFFYATNDLGQSTGAATLWIPYVAVGVVVVILALIFSRTDIPDIKTSDEYHLDETGATASTPERPARRGLALSLLWANLLVLSSAIGMIASAVSSIFDPDETHAAHVFLISTLAILALFTIVLLTRTRAISPQSIWTNPHFSAATLAQFFYVAAQAGIFAYFINYMTSQAPVPISNQTASTLASGGFLCFLIGRFTGAGLLKKYSPHKVLCIYALANIVVCLGIILKLGWISVACVFLSYFFMSIMFPTIFALGIHGLGSRAKKASSFIVMAIMGGAIVPKLMGHMGDHYSVSTSFVVPLACFAAVAAFGFFWQKLSQAKEPATVSTTRAH